jgi:NAD(P)-dependent dehydrogenase (short-subunit alcohol dehydrogenase family)
MGPPGGERMRIIVVGATGTIGKPLADALAQRGHEVVRVARSSGDFRVDITSRESIEQLFRSVGEFDALISAAGTARFKAVDELTDEDLQFSLSSKLMGQVNLVRIGLHHIREGGSFTLTSGILGLHPIPKSAAFSLVNMGLEGFARAASLEAPRGIRVNVVSPPWVTETLDEMGEDPAGGMPAAKVALSYIESVESKRAGEVLDSRDFG